MKFSALSALAMASGTLATAELKFKASMLDNNKMQNLMQVKTSHREAGKQDGLFDENQYATSAATTCRNGRAGEYSCESIDMQSHLTHGDMGSSTREGNDLWGWTADNGREFALVGQTDGTAFVEITSGGALKYIGRLPTQTRNSIWRDMKVIGHHVYIGSEASGHGMQVFDLNKLLSIGRSPKTFSTSRDLTAWYRGFGSTHNIIANEETNTIFAVGAARNDACAGSNGGLIMIDVSDPADPTLLGCAGGDGYVHDAQCVTYRGVDRSFNGHEICLAYNEDTFTIYDVTDKRNPSVLSKTTYEGRGNRGAYTHQGWVIDDDFHYLLLDDELDEMYRDQAGQDTHTTTYVFDISDLTRPVWTGQYKGPVRSIDHNQYIVDGISYQANYASGLRVVDATSVARDPTGGSMQELAHFDCYPEDDGNPQPEFYGAWSVYPFFKSGTVILNCIERGLFALKVNV